MTARVNAISRALNAVDRFQRAHRPLAFGVAVNQKYGDDRGGYLAALITYYGFLSIFPLMLAFFTIVAYTLPPSSSAVRTLEHHLGSYPILGPSIQQLSTHHLNGSVPALVIGLVGLVWGGQGLAQTLQYAMAEVYNVPNRDRPGFLPRLLIGLRWYATFGVGFLAATFVSSLGTIFDWGSAGPLLASLAALALNVALFSASFMMLAPDSTPWRSVLPGASFAGMVWTVLTGVGIGLLQSLSSGKSELYGSFSITLGLLAFLYLAARITLYAAEANVVHARALWPRALRNVPQTDADVRQLEGMARREERVKKQVVSVDFSGPVPVVPVEKAGPLDATPASKAPSTPGGVGTAGA
jgi:YihY family inner membrane protein